MKTIVHVIFTLLKAVTIIYFVTLVMRYLMKKDEPGARLEALKYFLLMIAIIIGIILLEFGIEYLHMMDV